MNDAQLIGLVVSGVTALVSLWTRVTVAELRSAIQEKFATKHEFEKLEQRVFELERQPARN